MDHYVELSRLVNLERLYKKRLTYSVHATAKECLALAQRFNIVGVQNLNADYGIEAGRTEYGGYYVTLHLQAEVIQSCVVSLVDVPEKIDSRFSLHVLDQKYQDQPLDDAYQDDDVDYSHEGVVDLGEIAAQYLSLSLNPYPRSPDIKPPDPHLQGTEEKIQKISPFSILKPLK